MISNSQLVFDFINSRNRLNADSSAINPMINQLFQSTLFDPVENFLGRPKKSFRSDLVKLGQEIAINELNDKIDSLVLKKYYEDASFFSEIIELLHSGSLIVDDIEDQSQMRRGQKTLHELYGIPIALNAGNWLYFWPLCLIQNSKFSDTLKHSAIAEIHHTLLLAHTGQALDIGANMLKVDQFQVNRLVFDAIDLKSGALTALAMKLGLLSVVHQSSHPYLKSVDQIGRHFGVLLQLYDDIGNLKSKTNPQKRFEDLQLKRPSFIWAAFASTSDQRDYLQFIEEIQRLTTLEECESFSIKWELEERAQQQVEQFKNRFFSDLQRLIPSRSKHLIESVHLLCERLIHAFK